MTNFMDSIDFFIIIIILVGAQQKIVIKQNSQF